MSVLDQTGRRQGSASGPVRMSRHYSKLLGALAVVDLVVLAAAVLLAWELRHNIDVWAVDLGDNLTNAAAPWIVAVWALMLVAQGAYSPRLVGEGPEEFKLVTLASVVTAGSVGMFCYLLQVDLSRGFLLLTFFLGIPMLVTERWLARRVLHAARRRGRFLHRVVAVGGPTAVEELVGILRRERSVGYEVVGACIPEGIIVEEGALSVPHVGHVGDTRRVAEELAADTVLVARGGYSSSGDLRRIAWALEGSDIDLVVVPSLIDVAGPRIHMRPVAGLPLLHVEEPQADEAGGLSKRLFDLVVASLALLALSPVFLAVALLIKAEDGGPVFFRQSRVGRDGHEFKMVKFRSMVVDAEARLAELRHLNESETLFKMRSDPRITRVGHYLRRFSIDEIPQLFNVLSGEMSLVGPRPPLAREVAAYERDVHRRLLVRPGMTGLWQVSGRSELSWVETVRLDLYYVDNWSMVTDLMIMAKTVKAVITSSGAY